MPVRVRPWAPILIFIPPGYLGVLFFKTIILRFIRFQMPSKIPINYFLNIRTTLLITFANDSIVATQNIVIIATVKNQLFPIFL